MPSEPRSAASCYRCGMEIVPPDGIFSQGPYRLRVELVNAAPLAPRDHVYIDADFHAECAAMVFRMAQGKTEEAERDVAA